MVRMTESQFALFNRERAPGKQKGPRKAADKPRVKRKASELPENIVKDQILDFLKATGWICTRQHVGTYTPYRILIQLAEALDKGADMKEEINKAKRNIIRIGAEGDADWMMMKPVPGGKRFEHLVFFAEFKAPGRRPDPHQLLWLERRCATGTPASWFDGFDVGRHPFVPWFRKVFDPAMPLTSAEQEEAAF